MFTAGKQFVQHDCSLLGMSVTEHFFKSRDFGIKRGRSGIPVNAVYFVTCSGSPVINGPKCSAVYNIDLLPYAFNQHNTATN